MKQLGNLTWYVAVYGLAAHWAHRAEDRSKEMKTARDHALLLALGAQVRIAGADVPTELAQLDARLFEEHAPRGPAPAAGRGRSEEPRRVRRTLTLRARELEPLLGKRPAPDGAQKDAEADSAEFTGFLRTTVGPAALVLLAGTMLASREEATARHGGSVSLEPAKLIAQLRALAKGEWDRLDPVALADAVSEHGPLEWRVQYNLACFYAQLGKAQREPDETFKRARDHLEHAVRDAPLAARRDLKAWAQRDPSLAPALVGWEGAAALLGKTAKPGAAESATPVTGLARIHAIGQYATRLRELGIRNAHALRVATDTEGEREELAGELDVTEGLVLQWAGLASLVDEIDGIGSREVNLLEATGVSSVEALRRADADTLHRRLTEINTARRILRATPPRAEVRRWIEQARSAAGPV